MRREDKGQGVGCAFVWTKRAKKYLCTGGLCDGVGPCEQRASLTLRPAMLHPVDRTQG